MEPLIGLERELAALIEAVETYITDARPATYDAMENAVATAKRKLFGT